MKARVKDSISDLLGTKINNCVSVSGGDISNAYVLDTDSDRIFCKLNSSPVANAMFMAEMEGLQAIAKTKTIKTPAVFGVHELEKEACLLMEYVPSKSPQTKDWELLGAQLAEMHQTGSNYFGWENSNFIGNLPQANQIDANWVTFYAKRRLIPQFEAAVARAYLGKDEVPGPEKIISVIASYCTAVKPSLLHGDLWSGNYLISENGVPYLIDPAVYFGHNEIDLAMSRLFGGFGSSFYAAYFEINPPQPGGTNRMVVYQLYYLLVHLNLFGKTYYSSVKEILHRHF